MKMTKEGKVIEVPNNLVPAHVLKGWVEYKEEIRESKPLTSKGFNKKANLEDNEDK